MLNLNIIAGTYAVVVSHASHDSFLCGVTSLSPSALRYRQSTHSVLFIQPRLYYISSKQHIICLVVCEHVFELPKC